MPSHLRAHILALLALLINILPWTTHAQSLVLDEEFTQAATALTAPLRPHLAPNTQVHFVVVASPDINAFVTGENIIFIHSGLVAKAKNAAALQGVLAHELAHIH
ncbi:MAG: peptidase M48, partial [Proteobacteria bacterium]|nr:peptidase M48 [Pseudomonadota bacterium]